MTSLRRALGALFSLLATATAQATDYHWNAASDLLPSAVTPGFTLVDSAAPENPLLANGTLTLGTSTSAENMYYVASGSTLGLPERLEVDFRMRYVSGATPFGGGVAPVMVALTTTTGGAGIALWIRRDEAFLSAAFNERSDTIAGIDTDDAFHDYRIVVDGRAAGSSVQVWQDGAQILQSATFNSKTLNGTTPRVLFGEASVYATGVSEWQSFGITTAGTSPAAAVPEPSAAWLLLAGLPLLFIHARRARRG